MQIQILVMDFDPSKGKLTISHGEEIISKHEIPEEFLDLIECVKFEAKHIKRISAEMAEKGFLLVFFETTRRSEYSNGTFIWYETNIVVTFKSTT